MSDDYRSKIEQEFFKKIEDSATSVFSTKSWNKWNLTVKQFLFCQEYLKDFNLSRAYQAVYKNKDNLTNPINSKRVQAYLKMRLDTIIEASEVDWSYLIKNAKKLSEREDTDSKNKGLRILADALTARDNNNQRIFEREKMLREKEKEKEVEESININFEVIEEENES